VRDKSVLKFILCWCLFEQHHNVCAALKCLLRMTPRKSSFFIN
ncbi:unnamed protein product, partial [Tenebrio molitor]